MEKLFQISHILIIFRKNFKFSILFFWANLSFLSIGFTQNNIYNKILETNVTILYVDKNDTVIVGSGVIVSESMVLTCYHVVVNFTEKEAISGFTYFQENKIGNFIIKYFDNTYTKIKQIQKFNKEEDLILFEPIHKLNNFARITNENIEVGEQIYCIGAPHGIQNVFTTGIICKNDLKDDNFGDNYVLSSFPIAGGNSGGGLFNNSGDLVAINQASYGNLMYDGSSSFSVSKLLIQEFKNLLSNDSDANKFYRQVLSDKAQYLTTRNKSFIIIMMDEELLKFRSQINDAYSSDTNNIEYLKIRNEIDRKIEFYRSPSYCYEIANRLWKLEKKELALMYYLYTCKYSHYNNSTYSMSLIGAAIQMNKNSIAEEHLRVLLSHENDKRILAHAYAAYAELCMNTGRRDDAIRYLKLSVVDNFYFLFYESNSYLIDYMKKLQTDLDVIIR